MAEEVSKERSARQSDAVDHSSGDTPPEIVKPPRRRDFTIRQDELTVPMPSYYKHIDRGTELGEIDIAEAEEWHEAVEDDPSAAATRRTRKLRIRWWGYLLFVLIYIFFKAFRSL